MNKFIHTTIKLSFLSVIISMTALLNTAPIAGATTQTAHNGQSVVDNRLILNPEIGIHITVDDVSKDYYVPMGTVSNALNYLNISLSDDEFENSVNLIRVQILLVDCEKTALQKTIWHITVITFGYVPFVV